MLLVQSFTGCMPLLMTTSAFGLGRRRWSSPQQCYLHCLCTRNLQTLKLFISNQRKNETESKIWEIPATGWCHPPTQTHQSTPACYKTWNNCKSSVRVIESDWRGVMWWNSHSMVISRSKQIHRVFQSHKLTFHRLSQQKVNVIMTFIECHSC